MSVCGEDLAGILKTRYGKTLLSKLPSKGPREEALLKLLGKVYGKAPRNTKLQWLNIAKLCGFRRSELVRVYNWNISSCTWSKLPPPETLSLPYHAPSPSISLPPLPLPSSTQSTPVGLSNSIVIPVPGPGLHKKEHLHPGLLSFLAQFFDNFSTYCPHSIKRTMSLSCNKLHKLYKLHPDRPTSFSTSCFRRIWKQYFKKQFQRARHRDGLCQLCEIGHKLDLQTYRVPPTNPQALQKFKDAKNVVRRHKLVNSIIKNTFDKQKNELKQGEAILVIDFKENITLGKGPRELGQSWYKRERRTIFGMVLYLRLLNGEISKHHLNVVSTCLTHDAIFVKMVLSHLFSTKAWQQLNIHSVSIWCDNAPHFRNFTCLFT